MRYRLSEKRLNWRKNQIKKKKRLILERSKSNYPIAIDHKEFWDEINITRHAPYGNQEISFNLYMSHKRIDSCLVIHNGYLIMGNNGRPKQMGMYRALNYLANILGRKGRHEK